MDREQVESKEDGTPFVGRHAELESLRSVLDQLDAGSGRPVLIEGEPGIGKTRLLEILKTEADLRGFLVLSGTADEIEHERPFGVIGDALQLFDTADADRTPIARKLRGSDHASDHPSLRFLIADDLVALVERLSSERRVVLMLDDLQWADPSTLLVAHLVARRLADRPVALIVSCRPLPRSRDLTLVLDSFSARRGLHLPLPALTEAEATDLAAKVVGATPGASLMSQLSSAAGNPLFVVELLAALRDESAIELVDGHAEASGTPRPPSLRLTILRRLSVLPPETLDLITTASAFGSSFQFTELADVTERDPATVATLLEDAMRVGVVADSGTSSRFRHDLIRDVLYSDMTTPVREALHMRIARTLAQRGAPAVRVGEHASLGASVGDRSAIDLLRRAAAEAAPHAPAVAARLLNRALDLLEPTDAVRSAVVAEMLESLVWSGAPDRADKLAREALATRVDPRSEFAIRSGLAGVLAFQGQVPSAIEHLERAASLEQVEPTERARVAAAAATVRALVAGDEAAVQATESAMERADASKSRHAKALALQATAVLAMQQGRVDDAVPVGFEALAVAERMDRSEGRWEPFLIPHFWLGLFLVGVDRFDDAARVADAGRHSAERGGVPMVLSQWVEISAWLVTGRWDDAIAEMESWIGFGDDTGVGVGVAQAHACLGFLRFHRGDLRGAAAKVDEAEAEFARRGAQGGPELVPWVRALLLEANGDLAGAGEIAAAIWTLLFPTRRLSVVATLVDPDLARIARAAGDETTATAIVVELEERAARTPAAGIKAASLRARALVHDDVSAALAAVEVLRDSPRVFEFALACEEAARLESGDDAASLLEDAIEAFARLGAERDADRAESALRARGIRRRRRGRRAAATVGWESLTETELKVVRLAAEGLTNRQVGAELFISHRTVETHLGHVFQKLGLSSRVELAAEAARHLG